MFGDGKENSGLGMQIRWFHLLAEWPWEGYLTPPNPEFSSIRGFAIHLIQT